MSHLCSCAQVGQIGTKWDNSVTFQIRTKMYWNLIWKVLDLFHLGPIWPTLGPNLCLPLPGRVVLPLCITSVFPRLSSLSTSLTAPAGGWEPRGLTCRGLPSLPGGLSLSDRWRHQGKYSREWPQKQLGSYPGMSGLALNWVRLAQNGANLRLFKISSPIQNVLKLILKGPKFVPFGANLTQYGANLTSLILSQSLILRILRSCTR